MQYIISQEEYSDLQQTIAELSAKLDESSFKHRQETKHHLVEIKNLKIENARLLSIIKDIAGTVQAMSAKVEPGSDFDIDEYGQVHHY